MTRLYEAFVSLASLYVSMVNKIIEETDGCEEQSNKQQIKNFDSFLIESATDITEEEK